MLNLTTSNRHLKIDSHKKSRDKSPEYTYSFKIENVNTPSNAKGVTEIIRPIFNTEDEQFRFFPIFNDQEDTFIFSSNVIVEQFELENLLSLNGYRLLNFSRKKDYNQIK